MSLLSAVIIPALEKQLANAAPAVANFALTQLGSIAAEILDYVASKTKNNSSESQQGS